MRFTLRSSVRSPFGRKVRIAASVVGLTDDISIEETNTMSADDPIRQQNPLGKIPALVLEDGRTLYDSRVIIEYFDAITGGGRLIPTDPSARFPALTHAALADGMLDAGILIVYEGRFRADQTPYQPWLDYQRGKIERGLSAFEAGPPAVEVVTVASIGLACALGYLDFRQQVDWRPICPGLVDWLDAFTGAVPAFEQTMPPA
jgi:glutathione S-transferase